MPLAVKCTSICRGFLESLTKFLMLFVCLHKHIYIKVNLKSDNNERKMLFGTFSLLGLWSGSLFVGPQNRSCMERNRTHHDLGQVQEPSVTVNTHLPSNSQKRWMSLTVKLKKQSGYMLLRLRPLQYDSLFPISRLHPFEAPHIFVHYLMTWQTFFIITLSPYLNTVLTAENGNCERL